jgi:uncharacterized membrane protein
MSRLLGYFGRGCLVLIPAFLTAYALVTLIQKADSWLGVSVPGLGLLLVFGIITFVGFLASNYLGRQIFAWLDGLMEKVPVARLLYSSIRDILAALTGEQKSFGSPVLIRFDPKSEARVVGFLTREDVPALALPGHVAVYVPQAYNIGGQVLILPRELVTPFEAQPTEVLTFVLSGGATGLHFGERKSKNSQ